MVRIILAILWVVSAAVATAEQAVNPPPRPLHLVGEHWTPYEPPTEFPPDANVYIIEKGDTLWDLAKKFLGDPYLWPQIWENNRYIRDAHWIYPGDPLVVGVKTAQVPEPAAAEPTAAPGAEEVGAGATAAEAAAAAPTEEALELVPVGAEDDVYCFGYLAPADEKPSLTVVAAEQMQYQIEYFTGDIVYLSGGTAEGVEAGQEYFLVLPHHEIKHPATRAVLGKAMRYLGTARVLCAQDHTATAEIISSCDAVAIGSWLKPFEPIPIPMSVLSAPTGRCDLPNEKPKGYIVYSKDDIISFGQDTVVIVDLGTADELAPGSLCTIYRDNPVAGAPRIVLGELAVLTAGEHWATGKIMQSSLPMVVGDRIEVK